MTDTPKPLTAHEIVQVKRWLVEDGGHYRFMRVDDETALRLIATIEQQREQIEKLRTKTQDIAVGAAQFGREFGRKKADVVAGPNGSQSMLDYIRERAGLAFDEAIAATEPKP